MSKKISKDQSFVHSKSRKPIFSLPKKRINEDKSIFFNNRIELSHHPQQKQSKYINRQYQNNLPSVNPLEQQKKMMSTIVGKDIIPKSLDLRYLELGNNVSYQCKSYSGFNVPFKNVGVNQQDDVINAIMEKYKGQEIQLIFHSEPIKR